MTYLHKSAKSLRCGLIHRMHEPHELCIQPCTKITPLRLWSYTVQPHLGSPYRSQSVLLIRYIYIYTILYIRYIYIRYIYIYTYMQRSAKTRYGYHIISLIVCQPPSARWGRSVNGKTFDLQGCLLRWFILNGRICMPVRARVCGWVGGW